MMPRQQTLQQIWVATAPQFSVGGLFFDDAKMHVAKFARLAAANGYTTDEAKAFLMRSKAPNLMSWLDYGDANSAVGRAAVKANKAFKSNAKRGGFYGWIIRTADYPEE